MKIKDLKRVLEQLDPELNILVDGYEGGLKDLLPEYIGVTQIIRNYLGNERSRYCGPHEYAIDTIFDLDQQEIEKLKLEYALILSRTDIDVELNISKRHQEGVD